MFNKTSPFKAYLLEKYFFGEKSYGEINSRFYSLKCISGMHQHIQVSLMNYKPNDNALPMREKFILKST